MDLTDTDDPLEGLGAALRAARRRYRWSQRELAEVLGVDRALVGRWETGHGPSGVTVAARVLDVLGFRLVVLPRDPEEWGVVDEHPDHLADRGMRRFPSHLDAECPDHAPLEWWFRYRDVPNPYAPGWTYRMDREARAVFRATWDRACPAFEEAAPGTDGGPGANPDD